MCLSFHLFVMSASIAYLKCISIFDHIFIEYLLYTAYSLIVFSRNLISLDIVWITFNLALHFLQFTTLSSK